MKTRFESLGLCLPEKVLSTEEIEARMNKNLRLDMERRTGIKNRRICSEDENSLTLAFNAARDCLTNSSYKASDLDIIINASITRDIDGMNITFEPAFSLFIKNELGAKDAMNFDIANACAGMTTGVYILDNMIKAGIVNNGMVVSGEHNTLICESALMEIDNIYDDQLASLTVGDCGAALIMDKSFNNNEGIEFIDFLIMSDFADLCIAKPSCLQCLVMHTNTRGMFEPNLIATLPQFMEETFEKHGEKFSTNLYDYIISHQVSSKLTKLYIDSISEYFKTRTPAMLTCYEKFGNTSSTAIFLTLYNHLKEKKIKSGSRILLISTASGINIGLLSLTIGKMKI